MTLTLTSIPGIPNIRQGDCLANILLDGLTQAAVSLQDGDIIVITQKIVSKSEGRIVNLGTVLPSRRAIELAGLSEKDPRFVELVLRESREVIRARPGTIIVEHRLGFICASAGIDHSNIGMENSGSDELVLLLPENPDASALRIRKQMETISGIKLGVMIIDSHGRAWRLGVVGSCIGLSGLPAVIDKRGAPDLFGRSLRITMIAVADELAAAASLIMGQADEGMPAVHVRGFPYPLCEGSLSELLRKKDQDMFR